MRRPPSFLLGASLLLACLQPSWTNAQPPVEPNGATAEATTVAPQAEPTAEAPAAQAPVAPAAQANAAPSGSEALERARDHMERGQELYQQARFIEAAQEFQAAYDAQPFSAFLFNAGVAYDYQGEAGQAANYFQRYLERDPEAGDAAEVRARIARLRSGQTSQANQRAGQTQPDGSQVATSETTPTNNGDDDGFVHREAPSQEFKSLLSIRTSPAGATITLQKDGRPVGTGPSPYAETLEAGEYKLTISHPDYRTVEETVRIRPGKVYVVIVEMSQGKFLGYLRVITSIPGASVFIDNKAEGAVGRTPFQNVISTGTHKIWIDRPGYTPLEREVEVGVGEDVTVRVDLTRVDFGRVRVLSNVQGAEVYIDDERVGSVPYDGEVGAGEHIVRVESDGMKSWEESVAIQQGQLSRVRVTLRPAVGRGGAWVTSSLAVVSIAGGVVMGLLANGIQSDLEAARDNGTLASNDDRIFNGTLLSIGADIAFGVGAILGGLATYYFLRDPLPDSEGRVLEPVDWSFAPILTPDAAGGSAQWHF